MSSSNCIPSFLTDLFDSWISEDRSLRELMCKLQNLLIISGSGLVVIMDTIPKSPKTPKHSYYAGMVNGSLSISVTDIEPKSFLERIVSFFSRKGAVTRHVHCCTGSAVRVFPSDGVLLTSVIDYLKGGRESSDSLKGGTRSDLSDPELLRSEIYKLRWFRQRDILHTHDIVRIGNVAKFSFDYNDSVDNKIVLNRETKTLVLTNKTGDSLSFTGPEEWYSNNSYPEIRPFFIALDDWCNTKYTSTPLTLGGVVYLSPETL